MDILNEVLHQPLLIDGATYEDSEETLAEALGPLAGFVGKWENSPHDGWNVIAIPGPSGDNPAIQDIPIAMAGSGFILETIPYLETITFEPIAVTLNNGNFENDQRLVQHIGGLSYSQVITSDGINGLNPDYPSKDATDEERAEAVAKLEAFFKAKGFAQGDVIHKEVGMLLYLKDQQLYNRGQEGDENYSVARMGSIPHGNAMLCLGNEVDVDADNPFPDTIFPPEGSALNGYGEGTYQMTSGAYPFFQVAEDSDKDFIIPTDPFATLKRSSSLYGLTQTSSLQLSTQNGTGGLLSIPFVRGGFNPGQLVNQIDTTTMDVDYWLAEDSAGDQYLQYMQNISLNFPTTGDIVQITWPHLGLNTLKLVTRDV